MDALLPAEASGFDLAEMPGPVAANWRMRTVLLGWGNARWDLAQRQARMFKFALLILLIATLLSLFRAESAPFYPVVAYLSSLAPWGSSAASILLAVGAGLCVIMLRRSSVREHSYALLSTEPELQALTNRRLQESPAMRVYCMNYALARQLRVVDATIMAELYAFERQGYGRSLCRELVM